MPQVYPAFFAQLRDETFDHFERGNGPDSLCGQYIGIDGHAKLCRSRCATKLAGSAAATLADRDDKSVEKFCPNTPARNSKYCEVCRSVMQFCCCKVHA